MKIILSLLLMFAALIMQPATASTHSPPGYAVVVTGKIDALYTSAFVMPHIAAGKRLNLYRTRPSTPKRLAHAVGFSNSAMLGNAAKHDYKDDPHIV